MGSSCLIKTCTIKKKMRTNASITTSFHRLPWKHPHLLATLQQVYGVTNVRHVTRWSRICSWHIAELAPLGESNDAIRRLLEYYTWNARSYRRIFEASAQGEACDGEVMLKDARVSLRVTGDVKEQLRNGAGGVTGDAKGQHRSGVGGVNLRTCPVEPPEGTGEGEGEMCYPGEENGEEEEVNVEKREEESGKGDEKGVENPVLLREEMKEEEEMGKDGEEEEEEEVGRGQAASNLLLHILGVLPPPYPSHTPLPTPPSTFPTHTPHPPPPPPIGQHSMIPDEFATSAMDAARDVDMGLEDAGKSRKTADDQDINDNHTKTTPPRDEGENNDEGDDNATDTTSLTNGEVAGEVQSGKESENSEEKVEDSEGSEVKGTEEATTEGDGEEKENEDEDEEEEEEEVVMREDGEGEGETQVDVMSDGEDKDSSEDDEDKLVISEGVEKVPEDSNDDSSKGEAPAPPTSASVAPSNPPDSPRRSEKRPAEGEVGDGGEGGPDTPSKRPRPLEEMVCLDTLTSLPQVESSLSQVKRDLEAMEFLIKQKEEEWNTLLRLQKRKEELFVRLARRRQTLLMRQGGEAAGEEEAAGAGGEQGEEEGRSNLLFLPQGGYSSLGGPQLPLMMMSQLLSSTVSAQALQQMVGPAVIRTREGSPDNTTATTNNTTTNNNNISIIDIHTSTNKPQDRSKVTLSQEAQSKLTRQLTSAGFTSMKPILPKPPGGGAGALGGGVGGLGGMAGLPTSLSFSATGHGPQGPTVNVQHLIAAHRKENPNTPPIRRATRGAWRNRYDGDKRPQHPQHLHPHHRDQDRPPSVSSSSSEAESRSAPPAGPGAPAQSLPVSSSKGSLTLSDPSVSYKDVLLRFAELTQIEKQPGSPQISIFPVASSEGGGGKRGDMGRETSTPTIRSQTPPTHHPSPVSATVAPSSKAGLEGAPSALAKLLLESRASVSGSGLVKGVGGGGGGGVVGEPSPNSHYLTLSALLSGGSTTTVKDKLAMAQSEGRGKKSSSSSGQAGEEGAGNPKCQGCHKQRAQFVCAGCGNQWYCSRECQVSAWEEHSEHCNN